MSNPFVDPWLVDVPDIQLALADITVIQAHIDDTANPPTTNGLYVNGPNIQLSLADILALDIALESGGTKGVDSPNLQLTAAEVVRVAHFIT